MQMISKIENLHISCQMPSLKYQIKIKHTQITKYSFSFLINLNIFILFYFICRQIISFITQFHFYITF